MLIQQDPTKLVDVTVAEVVIVVEVVVILVVEYPLISLVV